MEKARTINEEVWYPPLAPKQRELFDAVLRSSYRFLLASGPRLCGKTMACLHAIIGHAYKTRNANIALVTLTQSMGTDSGIWDDLTEHVIPQWIDADIGVEYATEPKLTQTKIPYCRITNVFGDPVKIELLSINDESKVERKFKSRRYSCIFINELSNFKDFRTFQILTECLRMLDVPEHEHVLLADTNPAEEGKESWIYKLWFTLRSMTDDELDRLSETDDSIPQDLIHAARLLKSSLGLVQFTIDDNPFVSQSRKQQLLATLYGNPDYYKRYWLGEWEAASSRTVFAGVFSVKRHVVGLPECVQSEEFLVPEEDTSELITGWDPGVTNMSAVILERWQPDPSDTSESSYHWKVLDELTMLECDINIEEFVRAFVAKMRWWEKISNRRFLWRHYSDRSAFDVRELSGERYVHQIIYDACPMDTPGGPIAVMAPDRKSGSVDARISLLRRLLYENRILINGPRCQTLVESLKRLPTAKAGSVERQSRWKHAFDALTYALQGEAGETIVTSISRKWSEAKPIQIPL